MKLNSQEDSVHNSNGLHLVSSLIKGTGEMADRIRAYAWDATPLGPIEQWPPELLSYVNLVLASREIMTLFWGLDRIMIYNDRYTTQLGDRHPMLGKPLREVWPEVVQQVAPFIDPVFEEGHACYLDDSSLSVNEGDAETQRYYTASFDPIWVRRGDIVAVEGVCQTAINNTAKIEAQQAARDAQRASELVHQDLRQTHEKLQLAMQSAGQGSFSYEEVSGLLTGDAVVQELFQHKDSAGPAEYWIEKVHEDDQQRVRDDFAAAIRGEKPYNIEHRVVQSDGIRWIQARARLISTPGEPAVLIGVSEDITLRKQHADALRQTEKLAAVGKLAASIAHEINNPLESVTNLIYLAQSASEISEETHGYLEVADRELRRASNIVSQTLRFYKQATASTYCTGEALFQELLAIYRGRIVNAHIVVQEHYNSQAGVQCLEGEIRQVLSNLVSNAIDAMPRGGRLLLRSRKATHPKTGRTGLSLTVADTGFGMSPAVLQKIFEAFYTTKGIGGTGLGLWVSQEIIDRHEGLLRVRSRQSDSASGSVFRLFLPERQAARS